MDENTLKTREEVTKEIYKPAFDNIANLTELLKSVEDWKSEVNLLLELSKEFKNLFYAYKDFPDLSKNYQNLCERYVQLRKGNLWKSIYYREKGLIILKEHGLIEVNYHLFTDVYQKYKYFIEYDHEYKHNKDEKDFYLDTYGETFKDSVNIVINDLKYANRGVYIQIRYFEEKRNYEELYIWYEIRGDIYLMIQLLLMITGEGLLDNAKIALSSYKKSRESLQVFAKPTTFYEGIYGYPYQTNFFDEILKIYGFTGYSRRVVEKMKFIEKKILEKNSTDFLEYKQYSNKQFLPTKDKLEKRIQDLLDKYPSMSINRNYNDWKIVLNYIHDLLVDNENQNYLNTYVNKWEKEADMQKWLQREINMHLREYREPSYTSGREVKKSGGNCDHYYKNIPICDKWKRDNGEKPYSTNMFEFIDQVYDKHKAQFRSYIQDVKLGVVVLVDSRTVTRENKNPDIVDNSYKFVIDDLSEGDATCLAIFVLKISDTPPSKRK